MKGGWDRSGNGGWQKKQPICETPRDLETSCTLEPILLAVCEKNLFCFIHSSASRKLHFSHTTGSHANLTMQVTQWQIAVQMQVSSETPHDLKTPSTLESILQVVREKTFFASFVPPPKPGLNINPLRPYSTKHPFSLVKTAS